MEPHKGNQGISVDRPEDAHAAATLASLVDLQPDTLAAALAPKPPDEKSSVVPAPRARMSGRREVTPLSEDELACIEESCLFRVGAYARLDGSDVLNILVAHYGYGVVWERLPDANAARLRQRRSARRGEWARLLAHVEANASIFSADHVIAFRRLAQAEVELKHRNGW